MLSAFISDLIRVFIVSVNVISNKENIARTKLWIHVKLKLGLINHVLDPKGKEEEIVDTG